ncbi:hypothetical protein [Streptomyces sulphureus]|uniref:hypothetical protein n=1 Tax=Streptomyces sulphureus TaxID=47758 RepID=UPI0003A6C2BC|nr:hypothetical protein [Streptomyces sulphureus]
MTALPHTRPRAAHWAATALALAAFLGGTALLQPSGATANPTGEAARGPDPETARYPLDCGADEAEVLASGSADFDGDGRAEAVAVARCRSAGGTPPSAVFVLAPAAEDERPEVVATLVPASEGMSVQGLKVTPHAVSATLLGYSSTDVPRCCPDKQRKVRWEWRDGRFVLVPGPVAGAA